jgi:hypothetical protein
MSAWGWFARRGGTGIDYGSWFGRLVLVGVFVNIALALPTVLVPNLVLGVMGLPPTQEPMWANFAALLLILLSLFYIPGAIDPVRYRASAWLAVIARLAGAVFFLGTPFRHDWALFGWLDVTFLMPEGLLLVLAERAAMAGQEGGLSKALTASLCAHWRRLAVLGIALAIVGLLSIVTWYKLFREVAPVETASDENHFKYGSIGTEDESGLPLHLWKALPRVCPDLLPEPGGYASLGMIYEPGHDTPIGFSIKTIGFPRIAVNCALCHTSTVRDSEGVPPRVILAGGASQLDVQAYLRFLFRCAEDSRFTADRILEEIQRDGAPLSMLDRTLYRHLLIPQTRKRILEQRDDYAWMDSRPRWGRGRIEPFNPVKFTMLKLPVDHTIGVTDFLPLWKLTAVDGWSYHWDGLNTDLGEVMRSSALGDGATTRSIALPGLERTRRWLAGQAPPRYPLPIDLARATEGKRVFETAGCADCHAPGGKRFRTVIPVDEPGLETDRRRIDMWTMEAKDTYMKVADGTSWPFRHFRKTSGYVALPLDGLWLRAPYLHNGSVPTLYHLLDPDKRVSRFRRGDDVIDPELVGFVFEPPTDKARAASFLQRTTELDTSLPGNGNQGHTYGADLGPDDKSALIEYLKTL